MATVLGVHQVELLPGADPSDFEQACREVVALPTYPGWRTRVLRGERGPRTGKYLIVFEIDSLADRDRIFATEGEHSAAGEAFDEQHPATAAAWERVFGLADVANDVADDYVTVAE